MNEVDKTQDNGQDTNKEAEAAIRSERMTITDMPRDPQRALGGTRQVICATFNYCRRYKAKMAVLKAVVKYTLERIEQWEREMGVVTEVDDEPDVAPEPTGENVPETPAPTPASEVPKEAPKEEVTEEVTATTTPTTTVKGTK